MKKDTCTIGAEEQQKDEQKIAYQTPQVTDLGKVRELTAVEEDEVLSVDIW